MRTKPAGDIARHTMRPKLTPQTLIFLTVVVDLIGFGIVIPILPLYAEHFGATPTVIGFLIAVFSLMQFIFTPILGALSDRIGRRPILALSVIGSALAFATMGFAHSLWMLFLGRILDGISGGNISTAQAYIADITPVEHRARGVGLIGAGFGVGLVVGPLLGGLAAHFGPRVPFFVAAAIAAANSIAILAILPETRHRTTAGSPRLGGRSQWHTLLAHHGIATPIAIYVLAVLAMTMVYAVYALFLQKRFGFTPSGVGYMFFALGIIGVITQLRFIGPAVKRFGEVRLTWIAPFALAFGLVCIAGSPSLPWLWVALALYGVANGFCNTVILAVVSQRAPAEWQGRAIGMTQGAAALSRAIGPVVAGALFGRVSPAAPLLAAAAVSTLAGILAVASLRPLVRAVSP